MGLRRRGFTAETISGLKKAFRLMYRQNLPLTELKKLLAELVKETKEVQMILTALEVSKRGIIRKSAAE